MKVLILNNRFPSPRKPFVASYVRSIGDIIKELGYEVEYLVHQGNSVAKIAQAIDLASYNLKILSSGKMRRADLLMVNHFHLFWPSLRRKIDSDQKLIIHWHGSELRGSKWLQNTREWADDQLLQAAWHIFPSHFYRELVFEKVCIFKNWRVIPSGGVDLELFRQKEHDEIGKKVVGFASHLNHLKGVDFVEKLLMEEDPEISRLKFRALNYGDQKGVIASHLKSLGMEIFPPLKKEEMPSFYQALDLLLFPTRSESLGLVPLEAMACGVPVVSPGAFACVEYTIPGKSGEIYEPDNYSSFLATVRKAISKCGDYTPREVVISKYSREKVIKKYKELFRMIG